MPRMKSPATVERDPEQRLIDAALTLAERQGWRRTGLAEIADGAGLSLAEAYLLHRSKPAIVDAFMRRVDAAMLAGAEEDREGAPRDRLFDTLMRRFDALAPHRPALKAIFRDSFTDPAALLHGLGIARAMVWALEAAGVSAVGVQGHLRVHLLGVLYLSVTRTFFEDQSPDLARTMAALDRTLRRSGSFLGLDRAAKPAAAAGAAA